MSKIEVTVPISHRYFMRKSSLWLRNHIEWLERQTGEVANVNGWRVDKQTLASEAVRLHRKLPE
jgi:hypothetical protein